MGNGRKYNSIHILFLRSFIICRDSETFNITPSRNTICEKN